MLNFINKIIIVSLLVCMINCSAPADNKLFEGKVIYVNNFDCYHPKKTSDYYKGIYGDTVIIYLKGADYHQKYNSKAQDGIKSLTYNASKNLAYLRTNLNDSIQAFYCEEDPSKKILQRILESTTTEVLGKKCMKLSFESEFSGYSKSNLQNTYYYSTDTLAIGKNKFDKHSMSYLNQLGAEGHFYLMYEFTDYETHKRTQTAINILEEQVDTNLFYIDESLLR